MTLLDDGHERPRTLIDDLLAEQQRLTAVERFARKHDEHSIPAQARYYRELIPLTKPQPGEQYAFAVDLDACTGCKACVSACHSLNGLDENETWRDTGLLHSGASDEPWQRTITTACHHCVEPGCLEGCPVRAYEKDAATGIVRHLDDQCIGCQYCVLKCPYDVPKYSKQRGIVRKCDMCYNRLTNDEAPACVQACPSGAITIRIVEQSAHVASIAPGTSMLPGTFDSSYTRPTTVYESRRSIPLNARAGDSSALRLEHAHWPLIWMLVLTQIAAGIYFCSATLAIFDRALFSATEAPIALVAFLVLNLGLAVSVLHLGRPLGAWRAFLGLRTSWMSREIFAFTLFTGAAAAWLVAQASSLWHWRWLYSLLIFAPKSIAHFASWKLALLCALLGALGVFCSAMIYVDTRRAFWNRASTFPKFFGTALLLGSAGTAAMLGWLGFAANARTLEIAAMLVCAPLFAWELNHFRGALRNENNARHRSALVIWKLLRPLAKARGVLFFGSMLFCALAICGAGEGSATCAMISFLLMLVSQIIERYFFFTAVIAPRMPGGIAS